jgi:hypothetical protein
LEVEVSGPRESQEQRQGGGGVGTGSGQWKVQEWLGSGSSSGSGGSPYITPPLRVHVLMCRVKSDVGEVDLADASRSSWLGMVKLLD